MSLPQLKLCLTECDRRDASLALTAMRGVHAGAAPLFVGDKGSEVKKEFTRNCEEVITPAKHRKKVSMFESLMPLVPQHLRHLLKKKPKQ